MKKTLKFLLIVFVAIIATGCNNKESIIIYSSMEEFRNNDLSEKLKEKFPEYDVQLQYMPTGNNAAKIKAEGTNVEADIILALEASHMENLKDNFMDLDVNTDKYIEGINPEHKKYLIWEKYTASIIIDKTYFEKNKLSIPKTYEDLLKKEYKGLIAMPDTKTSGTGYMYYLNVYNIMGEKKALEYFDKLSNNIKQFTTSGSGPINLLKQGEIAIAMGMTFQGADEITNGANFEIIELKTGTPYNYTGVGIIDKEEKKERVNDVFNWIITDFMIYDKENYVPGTVLKNQENYVENFPKNLKDADMKNINSIDKKEELISKWQH